MICGSSISTGFWEGTCDCGDHRFWHGHDKLNVHWLHLDLPKSVEAYYQETGRAGRDGLPANAWMAYGLQDVITLRQMLAGSNADEAHKRIEYHKLESMLALCEQVHCRRQALLGYFGDRLEQPCGNCDTCLEPVETWDGTLAARQALSCIHRQQRFGVAYLIDVLLGNRADSVHHDKQPSAYSDRTRSNGMVFSSWSHAVGCCGLTAGALKLTEARRPILQANSNRCCRKDRSRKNKGGRPAAVAKVTIRCSERFTRQAQDDCQNVPPYVIS
jgi:ATP-dependent DNA helicase RecQ